MLVSSLTVVATEWTDRLEILPLAGLVGLIAGHLLSLSSFRSTTSHLFSAVYGLAWVGFLVGSGLPEGLSWRERILELGGRVSGWVQQALSGGTSQDSLIFLLFLAILFWILGYSAAWNTYRHRRAWLAALPLGIVSIVVTHFYIGDAPLLRYVVLYLLLALLYIGRADAFRRQDRWRREHVAYDPKLGIDVLRSSLILAVLVLTLAWALPSTSSAATSVSEIWERINTPWETVEEEWQRLFSSIHSGTTEIAEPFGSSLGLGGPSGLKDTLVLDIEAPREGRYYWRAAAYATYNGAEWQLPKGPMISLGPGTQAVAVAKEASRRTVSQKMTNYLPGRHLLLAASQLTAVDREAEALVRTHDGSPVAFHRVSAVLPLGAGEQYTVTSHVSQASSPELRQASTDYPSWVREQYLQLPNGLPERVHALAEATTSAASSPYDKAKLLEHYLRDAISYDLSPPAIPPGRDYVDFLLFDSQRAYCNGYATAMVVMARSLGVPARLATGYAQGEYDEQRRVFRIRENNAHSWSEIYFPGYGWIEFEPTVSEAPLTRLDPGPGTTTEPPPPPGTNQDLADNFQFDEESDLPIPDEGSEALPDQDVASQGASLWRWAVGILLFGALAAGGWWAAENLGLQHLPAAEQAYARLLRFGRWLGRPLQTPDTPIEWAQDLSAVVPKARDPITRIVALYVEAQFGKGDSAAPAANISWSQARILLWRHLLWERWLGRLDLAAAERDTNA